MTELESSVVVLNDAPPIAESRIFGVDDHRTVYTPLGDAPSDSPGTAELAADAPVPTPETETETETVQKPETEIETVQKPETQTHSNVLKIALVSGAIVTCIAGIFVARHYLSTHADVSDKISSIARIVASDISARVTNIFRQ